MLDFAYHISVKHNIRNEEEYKQKMNEMEKIELKKRRFSDYVNQLKNWMREGKITSEEYRGLITKWQKEHREM